MLRCRLLNGCQCVCRSPHLYASAYVKPFLRQYGRVVFKILFGQLQGAPNESRGYAAQLGGMAEPGYLRHHANECDRQITNAGDATDVRERELRYPCPVQCHK